MHKKNTAKIGSIPKSPDILEIFSPERDQPLGSTFLRSKYITIKQVENKSNLISQKRLVILIKFNSKLL